MLAVANQPADNGVPEAALHRPPAPTGAGDPVGGLLVPLRPRRDGLRPRVHRPALPAVTQLVDHLLGVSPTVADVVIGALGVRRGRPVRRVRAAWGEDCRHPLRRAGRCQRLSLTGQLVLIVTAAIVRGHGSLPGRQARRACVLAFRPLRRHAGRLNGAREFLRRRGGSVVLLARSRFLTGRHAGPGRPEPVALPAVPGVDPGRPRGRRHRGPDHGPTSATGCSRCGSRWCRKKPLVFAVRLCRRVPLPTRTPNYY